MQCVQGILNLAPNGPNDGGLIVMKGSSALNEEFFATHESKQTTWGPADWYGFSEKDVEWFKSKGCEAIKVCADPGDLILWDSRQVHYNELPKSDAVRSVLCMTSSPISRYRVPMLTLGRSMLLSGFLCRSGRLKEEGRLIQEAYRNSKYL